MTSTRSRARVHGARLGILGIALILLALAGSSPVSADTSMEETGLRGKHWLREPPNGMGGFGAFCVYGEATHRLKEVIVRPPVIYARNATPGSGNDPQSVGFQVRIQRQTSSGWVFLAKIPTKISLANDDQRAPFGDATSDGSVTYVVPEPGLRLRALVRMFWFVPGSWDEVQGRSVHRVDHYAKTIDDSSEIEQSPCEAVRA